MECVSENNTRGEIKRKGRNDMWIAEGRVFQEEGTACEKTWKKEDAHLLAGIARKPRRSE